MASCSNCGNSKNYQADDNCPKCGFMAPIETKRTETDLIFCTACAVHYLAECSVHPKEFWQKVSWIK